jgi:hypothetical protein
MLIYNGVVTADAAGQLENLRALRDEYEVYTWKELLDRNVMIYKEQLKRVKEKNPTDPRVVPLWDLIKGRMGPAKSVKDRSGSSIVRRKKRSARADQQSSSKKEGKGIVRRSQASTKR